MNAGSTQRTLQRFGETDAVMACSCQINRVAQSQSTATILITAGAPRR